MTAPDDLSRIETRSTHIPPFTSPSSDQERLVASVVTSLDDDKAEEILVIDLRGRSAIADHLVLASGRSQRQVGAMADHLLLKLKGAGLPVSVEGMTPGDWVLIDAGDIVVHLFRPEVRAFYSIERMWGEQTPMPGAAMLA